MGGHRPKDLQPSAPRKIIQILNSLRSHEARVKVISMNFGYYTVASFFPGGSIWASPSLVRASLEVKLVYKFGTSMAREDERQLDSGSA